MTTISKFQPFSLHVRGQVRRYDAPLVMGILNVTPDSFYAGSRAQDHDAIASRVSQMVGQGADIIDVGGYSTRPGAPEVSPQEEQFRVERGLQVVHEVAPQVLTSVDTFRAGVAEHAVTHCGCDIINDVAGGMLDEAMFATVARLQVPYILMHMRGTPATMQQLTDYDNLTADIVADLARKAEQLRQLGARDVILDPGFGFSKTLEQNYELLAHMEQFLSLGLPLLVGVSRKSMIFRALGCTPAEALNGTTVIHTLALLKGAQILRVHDVRAAVEVRKLVELTLNNL